MTMRMIIIFLASLLIISCAAEKKPVDSGSKEQEVLYIYPDGRMEFNGRVINKKDVVVYDAGSRGERAAVKLIIPLHPDVYRDSITVERKEIDVPVIRK